jgi:hypothetical protein
MNPLPDELRDLEPTPVFRTYWRFVKERYDLYLRRLAGEEPWTGFAPFLQYKFTNVFRATDRVSQACIEVANASASNDLRNAFFRILLFKFFNKIETWDLLTEALGEEPSLKNYDFSRYDSILTKAKKEGAKLYSNAYMMPCPATYAKPGILLKHSMHLDMIEAMIKNDVPGEMLAAGSLAGAYAILRKIRMLGDFMAYQFTIDFNYSPHLHYPESSFVVAGPGAREGIEKSFAAPGKRKPEEIIDLVFRNATAASLFYVGEPPPRLFGTRPLQPIDIQNCFCETGKLARVLHPEFNTGRTRIKTKYTGYLPGLAKPLPRPVFPPDWKIEVGTIGNNGS